jgi:ribosomal protein S18 acetylase RimI-like enzyme
MTTEIDLNTKYDFRSIRPEEGEQAAVIEQICFPPHEACSRQHMLERVAAAPEMLLVAVDKSTGRLAGFLSGLATNEVLFRDEFFTDASLHDPKGKTVMLLGLDVLPEHRMQGLARELVNRYAQREAANGRELLILTCVDEKVEMYKKMNFEDKGLSASVWGGEQWHEMTRKI